MQRLFSTFPSGPPGIGLLLLRAGSAAVLIAYGGACLSEASAWTRGAWIVGAMAAVIGALLLVGLMTPLAGVLAVVGSVGATLSWLPSPTPNTLGAGVAGVLPIAVSSALALLGPGALSIDAALFGRREIKIPRPGAPSPAGNP